jgi:hypothetical protein
MRKDKDKKPLHVEKKEKIAPTNERVKSDEAEIQRRREESPQNKPQRGKKIN